MIATPWIHLVPRDLASNLRFRDEVLESCKGQDAAAALRRAQFRAACAEDLLFYVNVFGWTYDPREPRSKTPFITYGFQDEAMVTIAECIDAGEDFVMPKSRDMGASWMGLTVFEWFWHFRAGVSFLLISRNEDYVDKSGNPKALFWKIDYLHENMPRWLLPSGRWLGSKDPNRRLLHLGNADNGSVLDGESTTGDAGRGDRRTAMFIDEHAAFEASDGFRVLRATRDTTRCRGFNSTPQGANNAFYEVCHNTAARMIRLHWSRHPKKSVGLYETDKETGKVRLLDGYAGPAEVRKKGEKGKVVVQYPESYPFRLDGKLRSIWYDNECARCVNEMEIAQELDIDFLGSDYQFFDAETIQVLRKRFCREPVWVGDLEIDEETGDFRRLTRNPKGKLWLWVSPPETGLFTDGRRYGIGADVSAGTGASNSAASVVDLSNGEKVGVWRCSNTRPNQFAKVCVGLGRLFGDAYLCWDRSGPTGETFTKKVFEVGYGHVYRRKTSRVTGKDAEESAGYFLNPAAKTSLFEDYRDALGEQKFLNPSEAGMLECLQFVRRPDGTIEHAAALNAQDPSGARTAHGDEVVADALASMCVKDVAIDPAKAAPELPMGSLAWRMRLRAMERAESASDKLGKGW